MEQVKDLIGRANRLYADAKAILTNDEATAEDRAKVEPLMKEADELKVRAAQLSDVESKAREAEARFAQQEQAAQNGNGSNGQKQGDGPGEFKGMEEFVSSTWRALHPDPTVRGQMDPRLKKFREMDYDPDTKQMVENVGASGGFLVPPEFRAQLMSEVGESSIVRNRATVIRMNRRQVQMPVLDQTGTTAGQGHWFGGMIAYWTEEAAEKTDSEPTFRQVTLTAHKLIVYTRASDELVADSAVSLADFLSSPVGMAGCISWHEDYAFLRGTGVGQPAGIIGAGATITVNRAATSPPVGFADLANMRENFLPSGNGVWIANISLMNNMITMNGPSSNPSYIWQANARDGMPGMILGYPVIWTEKTPTAGTEGDLILADMRYYLIGDRQATTVESTQYDYWRHDQTSWRAVHRVDGRPWMSAPFTLTDGSSQISPFVVLSDKST